MSEQDETAPEDRYPLSSTNWPRVQDLLVTALDRSPADRETLLRHECADDPVLRREVESLLEAFMQSGVFLDALDTNGVAALLADAPDVVVGTMVGTYRVEGVLGRGGMGVVYRARDVRLHRTVALKFLPERQAHDDAARQRLLLEARAAAALDHTNIGAVHEVEELQDGRPYIAMAHYEGETLSRRISHDAMPIPQILTLARQIAAGLAAAHREGIVHRDVKPSNILITSVTSGSSTRELVKILDFGIARMAGDEATDTQVTGGTAAYMSPEQTQRRDVDERTDVWSFGVVLYEMLTRTRPFKGASIADVVRSILSDEPEPIATFRSDAPRALSQLVADCLTKDPDERCPSAAAVAERLDRVELQRAVFARMRRPAALWGIGMLIVALVGIMLLARNVERPTDAPSRRTLLTSYPGLETMPALSPDGERVAFSWNGGSGDQWDIDIYVKSIGAGPDAPIRLTYDPAVDYAPTWSPDGRHVAFVRHGVPVRDAAIYSIPAEGGIARELASVSLPSRLSWSPDGEFLYFVDRDSAADRSAIYRLSLSTLARRKLTDPPPGLEDLDVQVSPDGSMAAFARGRRLLPVLQNVMGDMTNVGSDLYVSELASGGSRRLTHDGSAMSGLAWSPDSRQIIFSSDRITGYGHLRLWRISVEGGTPIPVSGRGDRDLFPAVSADGSHLAYAEATLNPSSFFQYVLDDSKVAAAAPEPLIYSSASERSAEYSPDGRRIVFASRRSGSDEMWISSSDGLDPVQLTSIGGPRAGSPSWSPDGRYVAFDSWMDGPRAHVYVVPAEGGSMRRITPDSLGGGVPTWSSDGEWIYATGPSGMWKFPFRDEVRPVQIAEKGSAPVESSDGRWIYYVDQTETGSGAIWKRPAAGGSPTIALHPYRASSWGGWQLFDDGIYYLDGVDDTHWVKYFDFETEESVIVAQLPEYGGYVRVSPDRENMLVRRREGGNVDLVMLKDWQ